MRHAFTHTNVCEDILHYIIMDFFRLKLLEIYLINFNLIMSLLYCCIELNTNTTQRIKKKNLHVFSTSDLALSRLQHPFTYEARPKQTFSINLIISMYIYINIDQHYGYN